MFPGELDEFIASLGQPAFRTRQILDWLYAKGASEPGEMTNLPKTLRTQLAKRARITSLQQVDRRESITGEAVKFLFELPTGQRIESVLIVDGERRPVEPEGPDSTLAQARYFVDSVKQNRPSAAPAADLDEAVATMELAVAIVEGLRED